MKDSMYVLFLLVFCACGIQTAVSDEDGPCVNNEIRLKNGNQGLLEVCVGNEWGPVCDIPEDPFTELDQQVACFQLGYSGNGTYSNKTTCDHTAWTYGIACDGTEERLLDCAHPDVNNNPPRSCTKFENVYVTCPLESQVRINPLTKSKNYYFKGVLEHYYNGTWNSMCSVKTWTNVEYGIVCKQLGLTAGSALPSADRGYMPQEKYHLLTNVTCFGGEKMIKDCPHDPWHVVQGNCPYKPILVYCEGPELSVRVVDKTSYSVTLGWDSPPNLLRYSIVMSKFCVQPWKIDVNNMYKKMTEWCVPQNSFSYTYDNLEPDTKYIFSVYGYMDDHKGPLNNKTVTTDPVLTPWGIAGVSVGAAVMIIVAFPMIIASVVLYRKYGPIRPRNRMRNGGGGGGGGEDEDERPLLRPDEQRDDQEEHGGGGEEEPLVEGPPQGRHGDGDRPPESLESAHD